MALSAAQQQLFNYYQSLPASARADSDPAGSGTPEAIARHIASLTDDQALGSLAAITGQANGSTFRPDSVSTTAVTPERRTWTGSPDNWTSYRADGSTYGPGTMTTQGAQTMAPTAGLQAPMAPSIDNATIADWYSRNQGMDDAGIAQVMQNYGVDPRQFSDAIGADYGQVLNRYNTATGTKAPIANADVADWYSRNSGLSDPEIAQYMNNYGVTPDQLAASIGANPAGVQQRFNAATAPGVTPPPPVVPDAPGGGAPLPPAPTFDNIAGTPVTSSAPVPPTNNGGGMGAFGSYGGYGSFGTQSNPWMSSVADDIMRRTQDALGQSFNGIRSNAVGVGGLGGSRQGVAEGVATGRAMDSMQGQLANLYGQDWTNAQGRGLQQYNTDTSAYLGNQGQWMDFGLGLGNQALTNQGQQLSFYNQGRQLDQSGLALGADLYTRGVNGPWAPIQNSNNVLGNYTGFGSSSTSGQQGGGWQGGVGGALAGATLANNAGWWKPWA